MPAFVSVPKTTVNKYYFSSRNKDEIGLSWKVLTMERITIAH
jgi:hypothetical protein